MPNWSEPKITRERIKIDPFELIKQAERYTEEGDYYSAERTYVAALKNAIDTPSQAEIKSKVKNGLTSVYDAWAVYCVNNNMFDEAEQVLKKELNVVSNPWDVKTSLRNLYEIWGDSLVNNGQYRNAESRFIAALQIEIELKRSDINHCDLLKKIREIKYAYGDKENKKIGDMLYVYNSSVNTYRTKAIILGIIGIYSLLLRDFDKFGGLCAVPYLFIFVFPLFSAIFWGMELERMVITGKKMIAGLFMFSFTVILMIALVSNAFIAEIIVIPFGLLCILQSIKMFVFANVCVSEKDVVNSLIRQNLRNVIINCGGCGQKLKIPADKRIEVTCPKCKWKTVVNESSKHN